MSAEGFGLPKRLLREPHVLAHELRTPLSVLAGWTSLMRSGDIHPDRTPEAWAAAMTACEEAATRLNILISQACDEIEALHRLRSTEMDQLMEMTTSAIEHARRIRVQVDVSRSGRPRQSRSAG
jgi:signal transduction histidine kinase